MTDQDRGTAVEGTLRLVRTCEVEIDVGGGILEMWAPCGVPIVYETTGCLHSDCPPDRITYTCEDGHTEHQPPGHPVEAVKRE